MGDIVLQDVFRARNAIANLARHTPLVPSYPLSQRVGKSIYLQLEFLQETGSFKVRGASNKILSLTEADRKRGVIAVSTGNHGRAVGYVANQLGIKATICISKRVPQNKVAALQQTGAEVIICGESQDDAFECASQLIGQYGYVMIPPFDDPLIIAGQGTIGLEILLDAPQIDTVLVPLSGGGLISGIALSMKTANPKSRVIGVSMQGSAVMYHSLKAGQPIILDEQNTLADSLLGGIGLDNHYTYHMVKQLVDDVVLVSEEAIAGAMRFLFHKHHYVVEGAAAVGIAALLDNKIAPLGENIAVILSGGNVDTQLAMNIASEQEVD